MFARHAFLLVCFACSSQEGFLRKENATLERERDTLFRENTRLRSAHSSAAPGRTTGVKIGSEDSLPEGYPLGIVGNPFRAPQRIGHTEYAPLECDEAGTSSRCVRFTNDRNPFSRHYLRVFLDGEELQFTDGVGWFTSLIQMRSGTLHVPLLRPNGQSMHIVDAGEHHVLVELYAAPEPMQYEMTCEWRNVNFYGNLGVHGEWYFWGGHCFRTSPSN